MTADMMTDLLMAAIGTAGFSILFQIRGWKLYATACGGAWNWLIYLLTYTYSGNRITSFFAASLVTALTAEILARFCKEPVITLVVPMVIPLVPGKDLYDTMLALVGNHAEKMIECGTLLFWEVCAMSMGMIIAACIMQTAGKIMIYYKASKQSRGQRKDTP